MSVNQKPPEFDEDHVLLWFGQMEALMLAHNITTDDAKFAYVLGAIPTRILQLSVSDIILSPPRVDKYKKLKDRILAYYNTSLEYRTQVIFSEPDLGDRRPTQLLARLRSLQGTTVNDNTLKHLWLERLPPQIRTALMTVEGDIDKLASAADKIKDSLTVPQSRVATIDTSKVSPEPPDRLDQLTQTVNVLADQIARLSTANHSHNRPETICYYHKRFGPRAKRCVKPCKFCGSRQAENTAPRR